MILYLLWNACVCEKKFFVVIHVHVFIHLHVHSYMYMSVFLHAVCPVLSNQWYVQLYDWIHLFNSNFLCGVLKHVFLHVMYTQVTNGIRPKLYIVEECTIYPPYCEYVYYNETFSVDWNVAQLQLYCISSLCHRYLLYLIRKWQTKLLRTVGFCHADPDYSQQASYFPRKSAQRTMVEFASVIRVISAIAPQ